MSSRSSWGNEEKTIIYRELGAIWTWDEYLTSSKQEDKMIETVQHPITLIIDASHSLSLPNGSIGQFKHALEDYCQPCEKQILVSTHQAYWTLHRLIIQMLPKAKERFFIVRTVEEAYQLAEQNKRKPLAY